MTVILSVRNELSVSETVSEVVTVKCSTTMTVKNIDIEMTVKNVVTDAKIETKNQNRF